MHALCLVTNPFSLANNPFLRVIFQHLEGEREREREPVFGTIMSILYSNSDQNYHYMQWNSDSISDFWNEIDIQCPGGVTDAETPCLPYSKVLEGYQGIANFVLKSVENFEKRYEPNCLAKQRHRNFILLELPHSFILELDLND